MSVWPASAHQPSLSSGEGALVSVLISVQPVQLEALLEALARVDFPINPQIYHDAEMACIDGDGHETIQPTTLVEFPAYAGRLEEVRTALEQYGFRGADIHVNGMLDEIHAPRTASRRRLQAGRG